MHTEINTRKRKTRNIIHSKKKKSRDKIIILSQGQQSRKINIPNLHANLQEIKKVH